MNASVQSPTRVPASPAGEAGETYRPLQPGRSRLLSVVGNLAVHQRELGRLPIVGAPDLLLAEVDRAGLRGRGGAGFPSARKIAAVAAAGRAVVVANGAEGEPASRKDRTLLLASPHLVLDGLQLAAQLVSAVRAVAYVPAGQPALAVREALAERAAAGIDPLGVDLVLAPEAYVAGQESAVVAAVQGGRAVPGPGLPSVVVSGVDRRPTLVSNVETLAHLALLARRGAAWFRDVGTQGSPGTFLATISGAVRRPGVYEAAYGIPLADLIELAGGEAEPVAAALVGGYAGAWVPYAAAGRYTPYSAAGLAAVGAAPGAGVVLALPSTTCGVRAAAGIVQYLAAQGVRQCGPCRNGLPEVAKALGLLAHGSPPPRLLEHLHRMCGLVEGRGACRHPDGVARLVRSTLQTFAPEVDAHLLGSCCESPGERRHRPGRHP